MTQIDQDNPFAPTAPDAQLAPRRLTDAVECWHESMHSARSDSLVAVGPGGAFIATDRPVPAGTQIFLEWEIGENASAEVDAVVVWSEVEGLQDLSGFGVKFVDLEERVREWISTRPFASAPKAVPEEPPARFPASTPRLMANLSPDATASLLPGDDSSLDPPFFDDGASSEVDSTYDLPPLDATPLAATPSAATVPAAAFDFASTDDDVPAPAAAFDFASTDDDVPAPAATFDVAAPDDDVPAPAAAFDFAATDDDVPAPAAALDFAATDDDVPAPAAAFDFASTDDDVPAPAAAFDFASTDDDVPAPAAAFDVASTDDDVPAPAAAFDFASTDDDVPAPAAAFDVASTDDDAPAPAAAFDFASTDDDVPAPAAAFDFASTDDDVPAPAAAFDFASTDDDVPAPAAAFDFASTDDDVPAPAAAFDFASTDDDVPAPAAAFDVAAPDDDVPAPAAAFDAAAPDDDVPAPAAAFDFAAPDDDVPAPAAAFDFAATDDDAPAPAAAFDFAATDDDVPAPAAAFDFAAPDDDVPAPAAAFDFAATDDDVPAPAAAFDFAATDDDVPAPAAAFDFAATEPPGATLEDASADFEDAQALDLPAPEDAFVVLPSGAAIDPSPPLEMLDVVAGEVIETAQEFDGDPGEALDIVSDPTGHLGAPEFDAQDDEPYELEVTADELSVVTALPSSAEAEVLAQERAIASGAPRTLGELFAEDEEPAPAPAPRSLPVEDASAGLDMEFLGGADLELDTGDADDGGPGHFEGGETLDPLAALDAAFAVPVSPPSELSTEDPLAPQGVNPFGTGPSSDDERPILTPSEPTANPFARGMPTSDVLGELQAAFDVDGDAMGFDADTSAAAGFGAPAPMPSPPANVVTLDSLEGEAFGAEDSRIDLSGEGAPIDFGGDGLELTFFDNDGATPESQSDSSDDAPSEEFLTPLPQFGTPNSQLGDDDTETSSDSGLSGAASSFGQLPPTRTGDDNRAPAAEGPSPVPLDDGDPLSSLPDMSLAAELSAPARPTPPHTPPDSAAAARPTSTLQFGAYQDPPKTPVASAPATSTLQFGAYQDPPPAPAAPRTTLEFGAYQDPPTPPVPQAPSAAAASRGPTSTLQFGAYQDPPPAEIPAEDPNLELSLPDATGHAAPVVVDTSLFEAPAEELDPFAETTGLTLAPPLPSDASEEAWSVTSGEVISASQISAPPPSSVAPALFDDAFGSGDEDPPAIEGVALDSDEGFDVDLAVPTKESWSVNDASARSASDEFEVDFEEDEDDALPVVTGVIPLTEAPPGGSLDEAWVVAANHGPKSSDGHG